MQAAFWGQSPPLHAHLGRRRREGRRTHLAFPLASLPGPVSSHSLAHSVPAGPGAPSAATTPAAPRAWWRPSSEVVPERVRRSAAVHALGAPVRQQQHGAWGSRHQHASPCTHAAPARPSPAHHPTSCTMCGVVGGVCGQRGEPCRGVGVKSRERGVRAACAQQPPPSTTFQPTYPTPTLQQPAATSARRRAIS